MSLRDQINDALKQAMKAGDKRRISTLRLMNSAIKDTRHQQPHRRARCLGAHRDAQLIDLFAKMVKQRQESA